MGGKKLIKFFKIVINNLYKIYFSLKNVLNNPANVKELIPEFYGNDETFLINTRSLNLGLRQN